MILDGAKFYSLKSGGIVFSIPILSDDVIDTHTGADGKTIRVRIKSPSMNLPKPKEPEKTEIDIPKVDHKGKIYVVIDPGHGGSDCGAIRGSVKEKDITLDVSKRVEKLLNAKKNYEVFMTRTNDETVSLQERVEISENVQPDVFVSIHVNSSNSSTPKGLETHYYKENSLMLAKTVHASLLNHVNASNRGLFKSKFYVINHTTAPAILVEIGFLSNDSERAQILTESRKQATAKAIAEGIHDYFKK
jgi:N-acetylmuramoyl-L-alanine amidase